MEKNQHDHNQISFIELHILTQISCPFTQHSSLKPV
jgi:hypothetical protein